MPPADPGARRVRRTRRPAVRVRSGGAGGPAIRAGRREASRRSVDRAARGRRDGIGRAGVASLARRARSQGTRSRASHLQQVELVFARRGYRPRASGLGAERHLQGTSCAQPLYGHRLVRLDPDPRGRAARRSDLVPAVRDYRARLRVARPGARPRHRTRRRPRFVDGARRRRASRVSRSTRSSSTT
jgi:hypothetical protein